MARARQIVIVALVALVGAGAVTACGDSSGPGPSAASVTAIAGDSQIGPTGSPLTFPLSFVALGSSGQPVQGVHVSWSVTPAGSAAFNPQTTTTDANGQASTIVTAGLDTGTILIQASVTGIAPVSFHALVVNPCSYLNPYTFGQTINGVLSSADCNFGGRGWYYDFYQLDLPPGQQSIRITMNSTAFDTYVDFFLASGPYVGFDDDVTLGVIQNSQLDIILPGDTYVIGANSFNQHTVGAYTLATATRPAALNGCRPVWVARGITASDSITAGDCADSSATPRHYDVARIVIPDSTVLTISAHSSAINPTLALYQIDPNNYARTLVASNDDSIPGGVTTTAFIQYQVPGFKFYDILVSTSTPGETGAYTLTVAATTTFSPRATKSVYTGPGFWRGAALLPKRGKP